MMTTTNRPLPAAQMVSLSTTLRPEGKASCRSRPALVSSSKQITAMAGVPYMWQRGHPKEVWCLRATWIVLVVVVPPLLLLQKARRKLKVARRKRRRRPRRQWWWKERHPSKERKKMRWP